MLTPPPSTGYMIQDNKLGLTASLLAGRAAKCLLPSRPPLKGWAVKQSTYFRIQTQNGKIQTNFGPDFRGNSD